jgi:hypothetical protein
MIQPPSTTLSSLSKRLPQPETPSLVLPSISFDRDGDDIAFLTTDTIPNLLDENDRRFDAKKHNNPVVENNNNVPSKTMSTTTTNTENDDDDEIVDGLTIMKHSFLVDVPVVTMPNDKDEYTTTTTTNMNDNTTFHHYYTTTGTTTATSSSMLSIHCSESAYSSFRWRSFLGVVMTMLIVLYLSTTTTFTTSTLIVTTTPATIPMMTTTATMSHTALDLETGTNDIIFEEEMVTNAVWEKKESLLFSSSEAMVVVSPWSVHQEL